MQIIKKYKIFLIILLTLLIIIASFILITIKSKKNIKCYVKSDDYSNNIVITFKNKIKVIEETFNYSFQNIDDTVDKYDYLKDYLNILNKNNGIKVNLSKDTTKLKYKIVIDISEVDSSNYKLLDIDNVVKLNKVKEIKQYYENKGYNCK